MIKGALRRNKRMRRSNYPEKAKVKIISINNTSFESLHSKFNKGCNIILEGILDKELLVYDSKIENREIYLVAKPNNKEQVEGVELKFHGPQGAENYEIVYHHTLTLRPEFPSFYKELNEKANRIL